MMHRLASYKRKFTYNIMGMPAVRLGRDSLQGNLSNKEHPATKVGIEMLSGGLGLDVLSNHNSGRPVT